MAENLTDVQAANKAKNNQQQDVLTAMGLTEDMVLMAGAIPEIVRAKLEGVIAGAGGLGGLLGAGAIVNTAIDHPTVEPVPQGDLAFPIYQSDTSMVWASLRKKIDMMKANTATRLFSYEYGKAVLGKHIACGINMEHRATYVSWLYAPAVPGNDEGATATLAQLVLYRWWTPEMVAEAKRIAGIPI